MRFPLFEIPLPGWVESLLPAPDQVFETQEQRVLLAAELAKRNAAEAGGGPFGAAVFDLETGRLVAPGINRVVPARCSAAHAEIVALALAQRVLDTHDLAAAGRFELATTTEPCAMCLGALPWSGIASLVCGARDGDARAIGFDEGDKPADWVMGLERRGIRVMLDVEREVCADILRAYGERGGPIYGPGDPGPARGRPTPLD